MSHFNKERKIRIAKRLFKENSAYYQNLKDGKNKSNKNFDISRKLDSVDEEYQSAVKELMIVKRTFIEKERAIKDLDSKHKELLVKLNDTKRNFNGLDEKYQQQKLIKTKETKYILSVIDERYQKEKLEKEGKRKQYLDFYSKQLDKTKSEIDSEKKKLRKLQIESEAIYKENLHNKNFESKHIMNAASAALAQMKHNLKKSNTELGSLKILLKEERKSHEEIKKQLNDLRNSKKLIN